MAPSVGFKRKGMSTMRKIITTSWMTCPMKVREVEGLCWSVCDGRREERVRRWRKGSEEGGREGGRGRGRERERERKRRKSKTMGETATKATF